MMVWIIQSPGRALAHENDQTKSLNSGRLSSVNLLRMYVPILTSVFWVAKLLVFILGTKTVFQLPICGSARLR